MAECSVDTCQRPAVACIDNSDPPKWMVCRTCWMALLTGSPYHVRAVWGGREHKGKGTEITALIAYQHADPEDEARGPVVQV